MTNDNPLVERYEKWAGECPATEPERSHWLSGFGAYILGWQDCEEQQAAELCAECERPVSEHGKIGVRHAFQSRR